MWHHYGGSLTHLQIPLMLEVFQVYLKPSFYEIAVEWQSMIKRAPALKFSENSTLIK